jgi:hypothetical protein
MVMEAEASPGLHSPQLQTMVVMETSLGLHLLQHPAAQTMEAEVSLGQRLLQLLGAQEMASLNLALLQPPLGKAAEIPLNQLLFQVK